MGIYGIDPNWASVVDSLDWTDWNGFSMEHAHQLYNLQYGPVEILPNCLPSQFVSQHSLRNDFVEMEKL